MFLRRSIVLPLKIKKASLALRTESRLEKKNSIEFHVVSNVVRSGKKCSATGANSLLSATVVGLDML